MSRSSFAQKFKETVGEPPMEYLVRWRMMLAGDKLVNSSDSIAVIADSLGYESDSAFSVAFGGSWAVRRVNTCVRAIDSASIDASNKYLPTSEAAI